MAMLHWPPSRDVTYVFGKLEESVKNMPKSEILFWELIVTDVKPAVRIPGLGGKWKSKYE